MDIEATRDSVCAGDDVDAPHTRRFSFMDTLDIESVVAMIAGSGYLARIAGGRATWSVAAGEVMLGVVAQEWSAPRMIAAMRLDALADGGVVRLHFTYHAQQDPVRIHGERFAATIAPVSR